MNTSLGIIGLGEAGTAIGAGLRDAGADLVCGFDVRVGEPLVTQRARAAGIVAVRSLEELAAQCDLLICLTSATSAADVAAAVAPQLRSSHIYGDWNSASPSIKQQISAMIVDAGARFVDGAIMAAVGPNRHAVPVLLSGDGAVDFVSAVDGLGMRLEVLGTEPGQASAVKMFRSLLVKGLEALVIECLLGARKFGVSQRVLDSMHDSLPTENWKELADYLIARSLAHGARRADELRHVAATLSGAGVEPLLAVAGARRLERFTEMDLPPATSGEPTRHLHDVLIWLFAAGDD